MEWKNGLRNKKWKAAEFLCKWRGKRKNFYKNEKKEVIWGDA